MTYQAVENSQFQGSPSELFLFQQGSRTFRFTSSDEDKSTVLGVFEAVPIKRATYENNQDLARASMKVSVARNNPLVTQYAASPPGVTVSVTIYRFHETDGVTPEIVTLWIGRVINVKFVNSTAEITCEPIYTSMKRPALRRVYQVLCPHALYGQVCKANKEDFKVVATLSAVAGTVLTSPDFIIDLPAPQDSFEAGYLNGGYVESNISGNIERRFILSHNNATGEIVINLPFSNGTTVGTIVDTFPGCDHNVATCAGKFNNVVNYGGFPYIPSKNPFGGSPIF